MDVEELMGSRGRIRVLRVLSESRELNISEVGRRTGMNYTSVERLLREKRYGKIRIFEATFRAINVSFERNRGVRVEIEAPGQP
jgi:DNA-binding transcriptional ArsR family regulator